MASLSKNNKMGSKINRIQVKVKPNAKQDRVEKTGANQFLVWVKQKPQNGEANQAAIKALAQYFAIAKSRIVLLKGKTSRQKIFDINDV